jgi:hypothetical protein
MQFTFAYVNHNSQVHNNLLKTSLDGLKGDFQVVFRDSNHPPASSRNRYVIFSHQDISFSGDLLEKIKHAG